MSLGALYGGVILYLLGVLAFQRRVMGRVSRLRVAAPALLGALAPIGALVPALAALGMLAVVAAGLVAVEFAPHTALHRQLRDSLAADEH